MNKDLLVKVLNGKQNGSFFALVYTKDESSSISANAKARGITSVTKIVSVTARKGIDYDKQKAVIEKVANGKVLTHKLPWGEWSDKADEKDLIIYHKDKSYLRTYFCSVPKSKYFVNGKEVDYNALHGIMQNGFFNKPEKDCATINTDNIVSVG